MTDHFHTSKIQQRACDWIQSVLRLLKLDWLILAYILTGATDFLADSDQMNPTLKHPRASEVFVQYPGSVYMASDEEEGLSVMWQAVRKDLQRNKILNLFSDSSFVRSKDAIADIIEEHLRDCWNPSPFGVFSHRWELPNLWLRDTKHDNQAEGIDWEHHREMLDERYLRSLRDTEVPWDDYELPQWFPYQKQKVSDTYSTNSGRDNFFESMSD
jgi:hypothetical protein